MATSLYIATAIGLFIVTQTNGDWEIVKHALKDKAFTSIAVSEEVIIAGTTDGIWRSSDNGKSWKKSSEGLSIRHIRWIGSSSYIPMTFLVGTEPAGIFVSTDGGKTWGNRTEVGQLRDRNAWFLPYSPKAGCVRGFAVAKPDKHFGRIYAAVEVGGVLISKDMAKTWNLVKGSDGSPDFNRELGTMIHPDVHSITVHPTSSDLVTAATGGGLYRSVDGGRNWKSIYTCYIRAVWVDPTNAEHIIAGPADGVSRNGRIEETYDGGQTWQLASDGITPTPWSRHMVDRFVQLDNDLFAVLSNGELWLKHVDERSWQRVLPEIHQIKAIAAVK
ncbi:MAG: hypothetical protein QNI92_07370 [Desulfobacterales bacterium]|nr:hypothetical protein [Desulfobacterales bacterium]